jgi:ribonuclease PH
VVIGQPGAELKFVEVQGTAEGMAFSQSELDSMLGLAASGLADIMSLQAELIASPPALRRIGR